MRKPTVLGQRYGYRSASSVREEKPCPTCYAPMVKQGNGWACARHGKPTRP